MVEYDKAWAKYQKTLKILPLPITTWEFLELNPSETVLFNKIQKNWEDKTNFLKKAKTENKEIIITDRNFKIVFASNNIANINGYSPKEIIGKSPKMFQGLETTKKSTLSIKNAIKKMQPFKEMVVNYDKNGNKYCCEIDAYPKFNKEGEFLNYIAFEKVA
jgi:PAS domain S-box-containing protein